MKKVNIPSFDSLFYDKDRRVRALMDLYEQINKTITEITGISVQLPTIKGTTEQTAPVDAEESDEAEEYFVYKPKNGGNYSLGTVNSLIFSNNMDLMTAGCTITFTAGSEDFVVNLPIPYTYTDEDTNQEVNVPVAHPAKAIMDEKMKCESGKEYVIFITTIMTDDNGTPTQANLFSMQELTTPNMESNEADS